MIRDFSDEQLSAYLDGELSEGERAAIEAHLAADPASRKLLEELRAVSGQVKSLPTYSAGAGFADRVVEAALAAKQQQPSAASAPARTARRTWMAVVVAGVAATAAAIAIMFQGRKPIKGQVAPAAPAPETRKSGRRRAS